MSDEEAPKRPNAAVAIALAVVAGACLVFGAVTHKWFVNDNPGEQIVFGLRDNSQCTGGDCLHRTNSALIAELRDFSEVSKQDASVAFAPFGWITLVACLLALVALALSIATPGFAAVRIVAALLVMGMIAGLLNHIDRTNRTVARFVEALRYGDFSTRFDGRSSIVTTTRSPSSPGGRACGPT